MKTERVYLCDGLGCDKKCAETMSEEEWKKYECHHTTDGKHAKNKIARKRKWRCEGGKIYEI